MEFVRTTDMAEIEARTMANYDIWGKPLSKKGYIVKALINGFHDTYMDENHWFYYVLRNSEGDNESSMEVLVRDAWIKKDGHVKTVSAGVIGSVYTDAPYRGKNNIQQLMDGLHEALDVDVLFLYSELGEYYSKFGYKSHNVPVWKFCSALDNSVETLHYVSTRDDVVKVTNALKQNLLDTLDDNAFCLIPSAEIFDWYNNRTRATYWDVRCPELPPPKGIAEGIITDYAYDQLKYGYAFEAEGQLQYVMWYVDYPELKMSLLAVHATSAASLQALVKAACHYAKTQGMEKVEMWDLEHRPEGYLTAMAQLGGVKTEQNSSLSAIRFKQGEYTWQGNDKWAWF